MPVSSFLGLQTSLRALLAQQRAMDVTGHNVANANSEGYSRQEAVLSASSALTLLPGATSTGQAAQLGTGVDVQAYRRMRDVFLDIQYRAQAMQLGDREATTRSLDQVELALSEPGENGLGDQLAKLWSAWSDVANAPESAAARQTLVDQASTVATSFNALDRQLTTVATQASDEYASITGPSGAVADIAGELARLNDTVAHFNAMGDPPNDLLDRRDVLLDQLSALAQVSTQDLGDGTVRVMFGNAATPLVDGTVVTWPQALTNPGGKLGALLQISQPGGTIDSFRAGLDTAAQTLADSINTLHNPGGTGTDFFTYTPGAAAASLSVAVSAAGVRASTSGAPGANDIAMAIGGLRGGAADNAYSALVSRIGNVTKDARRVEANAQALADAIDGRRQSTAGVSLDEEMTNMVRFQRGYQAAARTMTTMDEMLDVLINRTGRVGL
jgi:flagellar hook-associated protein 1 FlgK